MLQFITEGEIINVQVLIRFLKHYRYITGTTTLIPGMILLVRESELQDLAKKAALGEKQAYRALLEESANILRRSFFKRGFGDEVDDIVQEALVGIHNAFKTYDSNRPYLPWMFAVGSYKAASYFRKLGRHKKNVTNIPANYEEWCGEDLLERRIEVVKDIGAAIKRLPKKQRRAFELLKLKDLSVKEASEQMGISESAVKVNAHRAYQALRDQLVEGGYGN